jgi:YgiT-type zinc finger domain-containing protein
MAFRRTDLPFKLGDSAIVVVRDVPIHQCGSCPEYLIENDAMIRIETILRDRGQGVELEVVRFAA